VNTELASSPDRHTFQKEGYIKRALEEGKTLDDPEVQRMIKFYDDLKKNEAERVQDPDWQQQNLEFDLRTTRWVIDKCQVDYYAQNLYAALCNMRWQKREILPILKDDYWSCSWRHAGGIVADLQGKGDYIDWYCSGIGNHMSDDDTDDGSENLAAKRYVPEGTVTEEIENDLYVLGWVHSEWPEDYK
jgi:hypothetical protein